jgi:hypothetical protein
MENSKKLKCEICGVHKEELITFDDKLWCEDCLLEETTLCTDCSERIYTDDASYTNDDDPICERCYDNNYFQCEGCERHYRNDNYGGDGYCQSCLEDDNKLTICPDDDKYYSKSRWDLPVGVEIEAEGGDYRDVYDDLADKGFGVQEDGSLEGGIEIQVPASNKGNTEKLVRRACKSLEENGFDISKRCGLHIHIEYFSRMKTIKRLLLMIYACEPIFYAINPQSRQDNNFCQPLNKAFSVHEIIQTKVQDMDKLFYSKRYPDLTKSKIKNFKRVKWNDCRYFGFNLHSLFHQKTIEFRHHAGTTSPDKIMRWIEFLKAILLYVRFNYNQEEVFLLIEQPSVLGKIRYLKQLLNLEEPLAAYLVNRYIRFHKQLCAG